MLLNDDFVEATITLFPPGNGENSDADSGDEDNFEFDNLSRNQLLAAAEVDINYGGHATTTIGDGDEMEEVVHHNRRSKRLNPDESTESILDVSGDLWADEVLDTEVPMPEETRWLSSQPPPQPPAVWQRRDLVPKMYSNLPKEDQSNSFGGTPLSFFNLFFDDVVINHIVEMTNLYAHRDKNKPTFSIDADEIRAFLAILLLSGYNPRPRTRMYWESNAFVHCSPLADIMTRKRFEEVMACFHLCDNDNLDRSDKMSKVRPFFNLINKRCLKNRSNLSNLSVDEAMLPYFGRNSSKQRIPNKPIRVGYKVWVLAEESGYVIQFDPYQGAKSCGPQRSTPQTWGLGEMVVLELLDVMPKGESYHVFMDNFFCSMRLLKFLGDKNIRASGTLRQNRISKSCTISRKKIMQQGKRGDMEQETAADNSTTLIAWKDNRVVYFASNCDQKSPEQNVKRYCRDAKQKVTVKQPLGIHKYNKSMGGVDRADQNVSAYRISIRSNKWWWPLFAWVPDMVVQNAWFLYRKNKAPNDPSYDLLGFRREVAEVILQKFSRNSSRTSNRTDTISRNVSNDIRYDQIGHFSEPCATTKRCALCKKNTRRWCSKCGKGLHDRCFNSFHGF